MTAGGWAARPAAAAAQPAMARVRDPRLDFFRGLAMFIILVAHIPNNLAANWIPARFGFSDATEMFVFCSGMASAIAFGRVFDNRGWLLGTARVGYRAWQVYWAHIGLFIATAATMAVLNSLLLTDRNYVSQLNLQQFFYRPLERLPELLTLQYVPNYFDILPMYLVVLAMMPVVVALYRAAPVLALVAVLAVWLGAQEGLWRVLGWTGPVLEFSSTHARNIEWFFNPFGWQLIFFTGFALMRGWLPVPPVRRDLVLIAGAFVLFALLTASPRIRDLVPLPSAIFFPNWPDWLVWLTPKTDFGLMRFLHAMALGYLAFCLVGPGGARLQPEAGAPFEQTRRAALAAILKVGQQSLAIFMVSMWLAQVLGFALDLSGRALPAMIAMNVFGILTLVVAAYLVGWFKAQPWRPARGGQSPEGGA